MIWCSAEAGQRDHWARARRCRGACNRLAGLPLPRRQEKLQAAPKELLDLDLVFLRIMEDT